MPPMSNETLSSRCQTFVAGIAMYSAKQPSRSTPMIFVYGQTCELPVRQSRQRPSTMCPSAVTRSPSRTSVTRLPTCTTSPANSWPTTIGGLHAALRPRVPVVDVHVGAADAGASHADQNFIVSNRRLGNVLQHESGRRCRLHQRFHARVAPLQDE